MAEWQLQSTLRPREPAVFTTAQAGNDLFVLYSRGMWEGGMPQVGKDLGELADDNVICSQCGLGLKNPRRMLSH